MKNESESFWIEAQLLNCWVSDNSNNRIEFSCLRGLEGRWSITLPHMDQQFCITFQTYKIGIYMIGV